MQHAHRMHVERLVSEIKRIASGSAYNASTQNERLRLLLHHHYHSERNSAWRSLVTANGIRSPQDLPDRVCNLDRLPIVSKDFLRNANYADRPAVDPRDVRALVQTSGSTGKPLLIPQSWNHARKSMGESFVYNMAALGEEAVFEAPGYCIGHYTDRMRSTGTLISITEFQHILGPQVGVGSTSDPMEAHVAAMARTQAKWSMSSPGFFIALAAWMAKNERPANWSLDVAILAGAPMDERARDRVMQQLGLRSMYLSYACSEMGNIGVQHQFGGPYSIFDQLCIIEVVDERGRHVRPGERGRVLLTGLESDGVPLIRYEVGDTACYRGRGGPLGMSLIDALGRTTTAFLCDAKMAFEDIAAIPARMAAGGQPIGPFQLAKRRHQDGRDQVVLRFETVTHDQPTEGLTAAAIQALCEHPQVSFHIRSGELPMPVVEALPPGELMKGRFKLPIYVDESKAQ